MQVYSFQEKQKHEEKLFERGISSPFLRSEEKGQAIAREIIARIPQKQKIVFVCAPDTQGMALLSAARLVHGSNHEIVVGVVASTGSFTPSGWKNHLDLLKKRGIKTVFSLCTPKGWNAFLLASVGGALLVASPFSLWEAKVEKQCFGEWVIKSFGFVVGIELPLGYPNAFPVHETWCLDAFTEEILDYPFRGLAGKPKVLPTYLGEITDHGKTFISLPEDLSGLLRLRRREGHKGTFGRLLIVGGSETYPGALVLAAKGALYSGCGLVTIATDIPSFFADPQMTYLPLSPQRAQETLEAYLQKLHTSTILVGNGWGEDPKHHEWLRFLLSQPYASHIVVDADGLNLLARSEDLFELLEKQKHFPRKSLVLTPHRGEAVRLLRVTPDVFSSKRKELTLHLARRLSATVVQKDATTLIVTPEGEVWYSCYGNDALAKGGSGDILAGLLAGLLTSGYDAKDASLVATFLLGKTAELFTQTFPAEASTPEHLLKLLPEAWKILYSLRESSSFVS
ncbi:MAG: NAD(P)H-hydrate dehydratase [Brevinematales bacterium]|nr:NAD(P)H-hydrate dehydratase [Brevinematales bacterium]